MVVDANGKALRIKHARNFKGLLTLVAYKRHGNFNAHAAYLLCVLVYMHTNSNMRVCNYAVHANDFLAHFMNGS